MERRGTRQNKLEVEELELERARNNSKQVEQRKVSFLVGDQ